MVVILLDLKVKAEVKPQIRNCSTETVFTFLFSVSSVGSEWQNKPMAEQGIFFYSDLVID